MNISKGRSCARFSTGVLMGLVLAISAGATVASARTLSYASSDAPSENGINDAIGWWADDIAACTNGSVKIKVYYLGSLVKLKDAVEAVSAGIADIAYVIPAYAQSKLPLWYLSSTGVGPGDQYVATQAFEQVRDKFPSIKDEEKRNNLKYIASYSVGPTVLISSDQPYLTPDDFSGDKVRLASRYARAAKLEGWNVTPVNLSFPEIYSAMERGTVDGAVTYLTQIKSYKHNEVAKNAVEPKLGQQTNPVFMNLDVWNGLSTSEQKCFDKDHDEFMRRLAKGDISDTNSDRKALASDPKNPMKFYDINAGQRSKWEAALDKAEQHNIEVSTERNPQAPEIYKAYRKEMDEVEAEVSAKGYPWEK